MPTAVLARAKRRDISATTIARRADRMLAAIDRVDAELSVVLTTDRGIAILNARHRAKTGPTDVLAFPQGPSPFAQRLLGDVVISVDTARAQAKARGVTPLAEATFLLAHGVLHLIGYDHRTDREEKRMTRETHRLVRAALSARPRARRKGSASKQRRSK